MLHNIQTASPSSGRRRIVFDPDSVSLSALAKSVLKTGDACSQSVRDSRDSVLASTRLTMLMA